MVQNQCQLILFYSNKYLLVRKSEGYIDRGSGELAPVSFFNTAGNSPSLKSGIKVASGRAKWQVALRTPNGRWYSVG
jgi:hypothetical protein